MENFYSVESNFESENSELKFIKGLIKNLKQLQLLGGKEILAEQHLYVLLEISKALPLPASMVDEILNSIVFISTTTFSHIQFAFYILGEELSKKYKLEEKEKIFSEKIAHSLGVNKNIKFNSSQNQVFDYEKIADEKLKYEYITAQERLTRYSELLKKYAESQKINEITYHMTCVELRYILSATFSRICSRILLAKENRGFQIILADIKFFIDKLLFFNFPEELWFLFSAIIRRDQKKYLFQQPNFLQSLSQISDCLIASIEAINTDEINDWANYQTQLQKYRDTIQQKFEFSAECLKGDWEIYREKLKECRNALKVNYSLENALRAATSIDGKFVSIGQKEFSENILKKVLKLMLADSERLLRPQIAWCYVSMGSLAASLMAAYSDADVCLFIDNQSRQKDEMIFQREERCIHSLLELMNFKFFSIGESTLPGFRADKEGRALAENAIRLIEDPKEQNKIDAFKLSLIYSSYCYGNQELYDNYKRILNDRLLTLKKEHSCIYAQYAAKTYLKNIFEDFCKRKVDFSAQPINIRDLKKDFIQPLTLIISNLALYHRIEIISFWELLESLRDKMPGFSSEEIDRIKEALYRSYFLRNFLHLHYNVQHDEWDNTLFLQPPLNQLALQLILDEKIILQPLYYQIEHWLNNEARTEEWGIDAPVNNFKNLCGWLQNEIYKIKSTSKNYYPTAEKIKATIFAQHLYLEIKLKSIFTSLIYVLCQRHTPKEVFADYYGMVPVPFCKIFYDIMVSIPSVPSSVSVPSKITNYVFLTRTVDGFSSAYLSQLRNWEETVWSLMTTVTANENSSTQLEKLPLMRWVTHENQVVEGYLTPDIQAQLFIDDKINETNREKDGLRIVIPINNKNNEVIAYAKFFPEFPAMQIFVNKLSFALCGHGPLSTLVNIIVNGIEHPVLLSRPAGISIKKVYEAAQNNLPTLKPYLKEWYKHLDEYDFALKIFLTLLTMQEDNKYDNIAIESFFNDNDGDEVIRSNLIDADHILVDALIKLGSFNIFKSNIKVQVKSLLLCCDQMYKKISSNAIKDFLDLDPYEVLNTILAELNRLNKILRPLNNNKISVFSKENYSKDHNFCYILSAFELKAIEDVYRRWRRLRAILRGYELPRHLMAVVQLMEPNLANYHELVFSNFPFATPYIRFNNLETNYEKFLNKRNNNIVNYQSTYNVELRAIDSLLIAKVGDSKNLSISINTGKIFSPRQQRQELYEVYKRFEKIDDFANSILNGKKNILHELDQLNDDQFRTELMKRLSLDKYWESHIQQKRILEAMIGTQFIELKLVNCSLIDDSKFNQLINRSTSLKHLQIKNCPSLSSFILINNLGFLSNLEKLYIEKLPLINRLQLEKLPLLRRLIIEDCSELKKIKLNLPQLLHLEIKSCDQFVGGEASFPRLKIIKIINCENIQEIALANLLQNCLKLEWAEIRECAKIKKEYIDLKKQCPLLARVEIEEFHKLNKHQIFEKLLSEQCTTLDLSNMQLPEADRAITILIQVERYRINNPTIYPRSLTHLLLTNINITIEGVRAIAEFLKKNPPCVELNLAKNKIKDVGTELLCQSLTRNSNLQNLNLRENQITDHGAEYLADLLSANKFLLELDIFNIDFSIKGIAYISKTIHYNSTLIKLIICDTSDNQKLSEYINIKLEQNRQHYAIKLQAQASGLTNNSQRLFALPTNQTDYLVVNNNDNILSTGTSPSSGISNSFKQFN